MNQIPPLNECMYCGSKEDLTDEHIIPYALWGDLVLPKSSCKSCAEITSKFERKVLKGFMQELRDVSNAPTRRKKSRASYIEKTLLLKNDLEQNKRIPIEDGFGILMLPIFTQATIFGGVLQPNHLSIKGFDTIPFGQNMSKSLASHEAEGLSGKVSIDSYSFARLLAKIAYGMYVYKFGIFSREESPILPIILGQSNDISFWIGSYYSKPIKNSTSVHSVGFTDLTYQFSPIKYPCDIKLFSSLSQTNYQVAVKVPNWSKIYSEKVRDGQILDFKSSDTGFFESSMTDNNSIMKLKGTVTKRSI